MKILMVLTSHAALGGTGRRTGFWLEELAAPYYVFKDAGAEVVLASPKGGRPPMDPGSAEEGAQTPATRRFLADEEARALLDSTARLADVSAGGFDAVFYPGGHGPLWDLATDADSLRLAEEAYATGRPLGAVCHGPAALVRARKPDGTPLAAGLSVTSFSDSEERAVGLEKVVPFSIEDQFRRHGAAYSKGADFASYVVTDGDLVTGQNPASSEEAARRLLEMMGKSRSGAR